MTFGPQSEEIYETVLRDHAWVKVAQLLEQGSKLPPFRFSYRKLQVVQSGTAEDFDWIAAFMGITELLDESECFVHDAPDALPMESLLREVSV